MHRQMTGGRFGRALRCAAAVLLVASALMAWFTASPAGAWASPDSLSEATWEDVKGDIEGCLGTPYVWAGRSTAGWDCSGFVSYVMHEYYGTAWPGGTWGDSGTDAIADFCADRKAFHGGSAEEYNAAFDEGAVKPGDIIVFSNSSGATVHAGIAGDEQTVYHAWSEHYGTCNTRFDFMWGVNGGHGKVYASFDVYRGLSEGGYVVLDKASADVRVTGGNAEYSLEGAIYGVFRGGEQVASITTDASGHGQTDKRLKNGAYVVRELSAPAGYALSDRTYEVTVSGSDAHMAAADAPKTVRLTLVKRDAETLAPEPQAAATLDGAEYEATYFYGGEWVSVQGTTENASVVFEGIPLGKVSVKETKAPAGYLPDERVHEFHVGAEDAESAETVFELSPSDEFTEQIVRGDLELVKAGAGDHKRLAGVPFAIASVATGESHVITTDANGCASTSASWNSHTADTNGSTAESGVWFGGGKPDDSKGALPFDTYAVEELPCAANADRQLIPPFEVSVYRNGATVSLGTLVNAGKPHVSISKTDIATGGELPGATLQVRDAEGGIVEEWASGSVPHEIALGEGAYTLHEEAAPEGYLLAVDVEFAVVAGQVAQQVVMADDRTKVDVAKVDAATGEGLAGAALQVTDAEGGIVAEWTSAAEPHRIDGLAPGGYVLHEKAAPEGYEAAEDVAFSVEATGDPQQVSMKDQPAPEKPAAPGEGFDKTGVDMGPLIAAAALAAVGSLASLGVAAKRRHGRKRDSGRQEP